MRFVLGSYVAQTEGRINACRDWVGKHTGKKTFGRPVRKWEENIKMDLKEIRRQGVD
jgi:hypothetical protein